MSDAIGKVIRDKILEGNPLNEDHLRRIPLHLDLDLSQTIHLMSEQVLGTYELLLRLVKTDPMLLLTLDDMNMRGRQIWMAFNGYCGRDFEKFVLCTSSRKQEMVEFVNQMFPASRAVRHGGAPK